MTEHIGIYRVERLIGRGGMGEVVLAWDDRLERRVAIKRVRQDAGLSAEQRERFRREARLAARLSHASVVQVYDLVTGTGGEGGTSEDAIVMEFVEGCTLAERLAGGPLETAEALRLTEEIAQGLAAAHAAGLIHRDLKAANVLVTPAGHAKILDFGLARPVGRANQRPLTQQGFVIGTLHAMSPEQARGEEVDPRSDLFSLGLLLYEMLTGRSPFRAADPAETLRRIVHGPSPDVRALRSGLPPEVEVLLGRLLAKERQDRPASADEVVEILARLRSGSGSGSLQVPGEASVSDLPTALLPASAPSVSRPASRLRHRRGLALALTAAATAGAVTAVLVWRSSQASPLRVAVPPVALIPAGDERLALAASGVLTATLTGLSHLEGLVAVDPREAERGGRSPVEVARATAAAEVLTADLQGHGDLGQVTLRRIQGSDGRVLWAETFPVPLQPGGLRELATAGTVKIRRDYPDKDLRSGVPVLDVRDEDYAEFLDVKRRIDAGTAPLEPQLNRLEAVLRTSPGFLDAQLLTAQVAHRLFLSRRRSTDLDRATTLLRQSRSLAPTDPRPLRLELQILLAAERIDEAASLLPQLATLLSGDPELSVLRAQMAERQGLRQEALSLLRTAVRQAPSWQNQHRLATMEARDGQVDAARRRLEGLLQQAPDNLWVLEAIGHLELVYGDLTRSETIFRRCVATSPGRALNNLGYALFLRGAYPEAVAAYRQALRLRPDHPYTLIGLADALGETGATREAEQIYRRTLDLVTSGGVEAPADLMLQAQCLARLGRSREAVDAAQTALRRNPDDPDLLYQNALVLSLAGDRSSALNSALAALDKGVQPRWFAGSVFAWLRDSPELSLSPRSGQAAARPVPRPKGARPPS